MTLVSHSWPCRETLVAGASILVVDDDADHSSHVQTTLQNEGYQVLAATVEAGIAAFAGARPDCVLLDVRSS